MNKLYTFALSITLASISTGAAAADSEWEPLGTGRMTDFVFSAHSFKPTTFDVEIEKSTTTEGVYRIAEPYANFVNPDPTQFSYDSSKATPLVIHLINDTNFYFDEFETGYSYQGAALSAYCDAKGHLETFGINSVIASMPECLGKFDGDTFTYSTYYYFQELKSFNLFMLMEYYEYGCNIDGEFMISLPGAKDYTCSVEIDAPCTPDNKFSFDLSFTDDAAQVKYIVLPGVHRINTDIFDSSIEVATATTDHHLNIDMTGEIDGMYTLFVATFDDKGNIRGRDSAYFDVMTDDSSAWTSLGTATYFDDVIPSMYPSFKRSSYQVEVEQNIDNPGLYRIVNPYGDTYPHASSNLMTCDDHNHYLVIDATDPDRVFIPLCPLGIAIEYGPMHLQSLAYSYILQGTPDEEIDRHDVWGKLDPETRTISFPKEALQITEFVLKGKWYPVNYKGAFKLTLPEQSAITDIAVDPADRPVTYHDMMGRRVTNPAPGQIVIRHAGSQVDKIIFNE